jgi:hypothetical protein
VIETLSSSYVDEGASPALAIKYLVERSRKFAMLPRLVSHRKTSLTAQKVHAAYETYQPLLLQLQILFRIEQ